MKPAVFDYHAPASLAELLELRSKFGPDSVILAGGQSLMPLLNTRRMRPAVIIDINRVGELDYLRLTTKSAVCEIGALTRHVTLERSGSVRERCALLVDGVRQIGSPQIRNRGTTGGSVAHSDPSAELPLILMTMCGQVEVMSKRGSRILLAEEFFRGPLLNDMADDEVVASIRVGCRAAPTGWAFKELTLKSGSFAIAAVAVGHWLDSNGKTTAVNIGINGITDRPQRLFELERALETIHPERAGLASMIDVLVPQTADFRNDIHATALYRREVTLHLLEEALCEAYLRSEARIAHA